jgi:hypothetical protein
MLEVELDSGASPSWARRRETSLTRGSRLSARERERERERAGGFGPGRAARPRRERGRRGEDWAAQGRKGRRGQARWATRGGDKKEGKRENEGGPVQERKRGERKRKCNSNAFEFEFENLNSTARQAIKQSNEACNAQSLCLLIFLFIVN